jgi:hypothetical protein
MFLFSFYSLDLSFTLTFAGKTVAVGKVVAIPPAGSPTFSA